MLWIIGVLMELWSWWWPFSAGSVMSVITLFSEKNKIETWWALNWPLKCFYANVCFCFSFVSRVQYCCAFVSFCLLLLCKKRKVRWPHGHIMVDEWCSTMPFQKIIVIPVRNLKLCSYPPKWPQILHAQPLTFHDNVDACAEFSLGILL